MVGKAGGWQSIEMPSCYRPQRSCGQGYVFTRVCDSVNRGRRVWGRPPGADIPRSRHPPGADPPEQTPPQSRPPQSRPPQGRPPQSRPPWEQTPAYDLRAAGTHPTGMHSCVSCVESWPDTTLGRNINSWTMMRSGLRIFIKTGENL